MSLKFVPFDKTKELSLQRKLFIECFPENTGKIQASNSHYNWKFHSFPGKNVKSWEFQAQIDDEMVGYYAAIPYTYSFNSEVFNVGMVCDVMTGVKARGKGVFTKLGISSTESMRALGVDFTMGYPIRPEVIPGHLKAGWDKVFELPLYIKVISFKPFLTKIKLDFLYRFFDIFLVLIPFIKSFHNSLKEYSVKTFSKEEIVDIDFDSFNLKLKDDIIISLDKSSEFIKWRLGAPETQYDINVLFCKKEMVGYTISRDVIKKGIPVSAVLDISVLNKNIIGLKLLIKTLAKLSIKKDNGALLFMCSKFQYKKLNLLASGFIKTPFKFWLIIKNLSGVDKTILHKQENWCLNWIDSDDL